MDRQRSYPTSVVAVFMMVLATVDGVTPVEKVTKLLSDLKQEVENDGVAEATAYGGFACFCKDMTKVKSDSIKSGQGSIDLLSSKIAEKTAVKATMQSELLRQKAKFEEIEREVKNSQALLDKEKHEYEKASVDFEKALAALNSALQSLQGSKPSSFLALRSSVERSFALADALKLFHPSKKEILGTAFSQKVDPGNPEYTFHSEGVIDTIKQLLDEWTSQKQAADSEWSKTEEAHSATIAALTEERGTIDSKIVSSNIEIPKLEADIATFRGDLVNAEAELTDDQKYIKDLTQLCESRAVDWDQRSKLRADEVKVLTRAIEILTTRVATQDVEVNHRALLQSSLATHASAGTAVANQTPSFFQLRSESRFSRIVDHRDTNSAQTSKLQIANKMSQYLTSEGNRLGSGTLSAIAVKVTADPFGKVKEMIQKLMERLVAESTAEATKKGFCDEQLGKAKLDRKHRFAEAQDINAVVAGLEVKRDQLSEEIELLSSSIQELQLDLERATNLRKEEKSQNLKALKTARDGLAAVKEAVAILKSFYKKSSAATVFVQASPVDVDTSGPGFVGPYRGKQDSSKGIVGLLQVIQSDFERTISTTMVEEKKAAEGFVEFDRLSRADISGKETKKQLDEEELETTTSDIGTKTGELRLVVGSLDSALQSLEDLQPTCVDLTQPYEVRVQKREEEIQALNRALCILDPACDKSQ